MTGDREERGGHSHEMQVGWQASDLYTARSFEQKDNISYQAVPHAS